MSENTSTTPNHANYQASTAKARETVEKTVKAGQAATEKAAKAAKETGCVDRVCPLGEIPTAIAEALSAHVVGAH